MGQRKSVAGDDVSSGVQWEEQVPAPGLRWRSAVFTNKVSEASKSIVMHLIQV